MIFLKSKTDFRTYRQCDEKEYELFIDSFEEEASQFRLKPKEADQDDLECWAIKNNLIYLIKSVTPEDEETTLGVSEPLKIFDREVWYTGDMADITSTTGAFITALIAQCWTSSDVDSEYRVGYLTVDVSGLNTSSGGDPTFVKPEPVKEDEDNKKKNPDSGSSPVTFNVYEYFRMLRDAYRIEFKFTYTTTNLILTIKNRTNSPHNVIFGDGHSILESQSFGGADTIAKVTVIQKQTKKDDNSYQAFDYYLTEDGEMSEEKPSPRVHGQWRLITLTSDPEDNPQPGETKEELRQDEARKAFGENSGDNKIEFWSDEVYNLGDTLTMRLNGKIVKGMVSSIKIRSDNSRYFYTTGDLATSLTDKLKKKG